MRKALLLMVAVPAAAWFVAAYPAQLLWGESAVVYGAVALALCFIPTTVTLAWGYRATRKSPEQFLLVALAGTGLRMAFVLGCGLALFLIVPYFHRQSFLVWVLVFYLLTLALETKLLVTGRGPAGEP